MTEPRMWPTVVMCVLVSLVLWGLGLIMLGTRWDGIEVAPGLWRDAISLPRWAVFWVALTGLGSVVAPWVGTWPARAATLVPLLVWFAVQLRAGTLAPVAWLVYAVPTVAAWLIGLAARDLVRRRWHAS